MNEARKENRTIEEQLLRQLKMSGHFLRYQTEEKSGQRRVLAAISHEEGIGQRELTERLEVKAGSLSEILGKLEDKGLILRRPKEEDKRGRTLFITDAGREVLEELNRQYKESAQGLFAQLEDGEKEQLSALLQKLLTDWKEQKAQRAKDGEDCEKRGGRGRHGRGGNHFRHGRENRE